MRIFKKIYSQHKLKRLLYAYYGLAGRSADGLSVALIMRDGTTYPKSSAFLRLIAPLTHPGIAGRVNLRIYDENTTNLPAYTDVCIVQRTAYDSVGTAAKLVDRLQARGIPLIIDTDDAFSLVDQSHAEYGQHSDSSDALDYLLKQAAEVWVSTKPLAELYRSHTSSVRLIPNSLDQRLWKRPLRTPKAGEKLRLVYMGTATHDADFAMVMDALDEVAGRRPGSFTLTVIGVSNKDLPDRDWIRRPPKPPGIAVYPRFAGWFREQGPYDVGLCPLVDNPFNHHKSDIKCLDYIAVGALPLVSDVAAYDTPALTPFVVRVPNRHADWLEAFDTILDDVKAFRKRKKAVMAKAQRYLWDKRSTASTAQVLLKRLLARAR